MTASPRSIGRWVVGICALASGLLPMTNASALSYPPRPGEDPIVAGSFFTVTFECEVGETVTFIFEGVTRDVVCSASTSQVAVRTNSVLSIAQAPVQTTAILGIARARFRAPSDDGIYFLTIIAGGKTYVRKVVVQEKPGGGGGGGGGTGGGGGGIPGRIGASGGLPRTGYGSLPLTLTSGFAALVTGAGLVVVAKRRRRQRLVV